MNLNVKNETSTLKAVVLGQAGSRGQIPTPDKTYDAKSYESVQKGIYPTGRYVVIKREAARKMFDNIGGNDKAFVDTELFNRLVEHG